MPSAPLPRANLHADLFRDNVLFDGPHLAGLIDFYNACSGWMLYDLAITLNDWCSNADGSLDPARAAPSPPTPTAGRSPRWKPSTGRACCGLPACASGCRD